MTSKTFDRIYTRNGWNGQESRSGPGSGTVPTRRVAEAILSIVRDCDVQSVLDVGCGDGYWMPDLPGYLGIDPSKNAIERARRLHPDRYYRVDDGAPLPTYDLVILRDALQHLSLPDCLSTLSRIRESRSRLLLASTYVGGENTDIESGHYRYGPDLQAPPFSWPAPDELIFDGYGYEHPDEVRDPGKHLGLWSL